MDPELDQAPELTEYYAISDAGDAWHLCCLTCGFFYVHLKSNDSVAHRQAFLDHAMSHDSPAGEEVDRG